jgi:hypothetical protein
LPETAKLRAAIGGWTIGDFEADPFLASVVEQIDPDGVNRLTVLHARATLLHVGVPVVLGEPVDDWRSAVARMLAQPVPTAAILLASTPAARGRRFVTVPASVDRVALGGKEDEATLAWLRHVPSPLSYVPVARTDRPVDARETDERSYYSPPSASRLHVPAYESRPADHVVDDDWLDTVDAFIDGSEQRPRLRSLQLGPELGLPWEDAQALLAVTWLALHGEIERAAAVRSHDGSILLHLGGGLAASLAVTNVTVDRGPVRAFVRSQPNYQGNQQLLVDSILTGVDSVRMAVPLGVVLVAGHTRADVRFVASPLLLGGAPRESALTAAHLAAARRASDTDDDD